MEARISALVGSFERGRISRRELIRSLTLLVTASAATGAEAQPASLKATSVNHISYEVADYARTRDFYVGLLGLKVENDDPQQKQCQLRLPDGSFIFSRNPRGNRRPPLVDHFAVSIANWDKARVEAELKRRGLKYWPDRIFPDDSFHFTDPDGYDFQLMNDRR
jgi:catechol 2,3-dioxygenase-like lactoylglutathione lyase family enzyme